MFKKEVNRLVDLGTLKQSNNSKWVAPSFAQTKPKIRRLLLIGGFRSLNSQAKHKPHPMLKIKAVIIKLEVFSYAMSLDLNMGYSHI